MADCKVQPERRGRDARRHRQTRKRLGRFAHLTWPKVKSSLVTSRATISIVGLAFLLTGTTTPAGACALICAGHRQAESESQLHCGQHSKVLTGMAHGHLTMSRPVVEMVSAAVMSHSCQENCAAAKDFAVSRRSVLRVTPEHNDTVALETTDAVLVPDLTWSRRLVGTPPERVSAHSASFTILRI